MRIKLVARCLFVGFFVFVGLEIPLVSAAVPDNIAGIWRDENANSEDGVTPSKEQLKDQPEIQNNFHGTYHSNPYVLIMEQDKTDHDGSYYIYSDVGNLRGELHPSEVNDHEFDLVDRDSGKLLGELIFDTEDCAGLSPCFVIEASADDVKIPMQKDDLAVLYVPVGKYDPDLDPHLDQTFGNMFSPISANFSYILKCWHLAKMNPVNYQIPGCGRNIFSVPDADSFGYRKVAFADGHNSAVPFAWTYVSTLFQKGEDKAHTMENAQDVSNSEKLKVGVKASVNILGVEASSHVSVGTNNKVENMYNSKLTYSKAEYLSTEFAFVLHKYYASLDPALKDRIKLILSLDDTVRAKQYDRFVEDFGTHYANAITFGTKGERVLTMNQKQVMSMHEGGVDVSVGLTAGYMGNTASVDVDTAKSNMEKITNNTSREDRQWFCYSGGTCNDGIPSGGAVLPIQLDLRPISELIAPPFFTDDETITTIRDGISRAIAKAAYVKRSDLQAPSAVFATVTGMRRYNITKIGHDIQSTQVDNVPCGPGHPCNDGAISMTAADGSTTKLMSATEPLTTSWMIPATLNPKNSQVTAAFNWSGKCPDSTATWEYKDSASATVQQDDLSIVPTVSRGLAYVTSENCITTTNPMGLIMMITSSEITKVQSSNTLLQQ